MQLEIQSAEGHSVITQEEMTDEQMRAEFAYLTQQGFAAFADTKLDEPVQVKSYDEAKAAPKIHTIFFTGPMAGG